MTTLTDEEQDLLKKHSPWMENENINKICTWTMPNNEDGFSEKRAIDIAESQSEALNESLDGIFKKDS